MQATRRVALDVESKALSNIGRLANIEAREDKLWRPPLAILNIDGALAWTLEHDVPIGTKQDIALGDPPEGVNTGFFRERNRCAREGVTDTDDRTAVVHPDMPNLGLSGRVTARRIH
jgi:hypothetical protein